MFWKRFISGTVILILTLLFCSIGGPVLAAVLCTISIIAYIEFTRATKVREPGHRANVLQVFGIIGIVMYYLLILSKDDTVRLPDGFSQWMNGEYGNFNYFTIIMLLMFTVVILSILGVYVFTYPKFNSVQVSNAVFGLVYITLMISFIYFLRERPDGIYLVWMAFIPAWVTDTCAYFTGSLFGKHKMTPVLSPKKSIEGAIGGLVCAAIAGGLYGWFYSYANDRGFYTILMFAIISFIGGIVSMFGDLAASAIKRNNDVKDYGKIIPGHGGILDRFDSVIFTAPMVFFLFSLFPNL
ncbi:MAG: phosphatidate cytidylyltransferase [Lachnospiraceae bacterium]|nr:phosphatidate cytidylyltransferase [Lachnospiraceae bacterium]